MAFTLARVLLAAALPLQVAAWSAATYTAPPAEVVRALDELRARYEVPTAFPPEALAEAEAAATSWAQDGPARLLADGARVTEYRALHMLALRTAAHPPEPSDSQASRNARPKPTPEVSR